MHAYFANKYNVNWQIKRVQLHPVLILTIHDRIENFICMCCQKVSLLHINHLEPPSLRHYIVFHL